MSQNDQELFQITDKQKIVGTQILDPNMPSDLNFQNTKPQKQIVQLHQAQIQLHNTNSIALNIVSHTVKGQPLINLQPQYAIGYLIKNKIPTFEVKAYSEEYSKGIKSIWQSIVGYTKRQLYFNDGSIYLLENVKEGLIVLAIWELQSIFKIFLDPSQSKIRLVLKRQGGHLINKDFGVKQINKIYNKIKEQIQKIGLKLI